MKAKITKIAKVIVAVTLSVAVCFGFFLFSHKGTDTFTFWVFNFCAQALIFGLFGVKFSK
jgi:hypothetical protein